MEREKKVYLIQEMETCNALFCNFNPISRHLMPGGKYVSIFKY